MKVKEIINKSLSLGLFAGVLATASGTILAGKVSAAGLTEYDHIFLIVNENHNYDQVIGSPSAPNINALAQQYGLANN